MGHLRHKPTIARYTQMVMDPKRQQLTKAVIKSDMVTLLRAIRHTIAVRTIEAEFQSMVRMQTQTGI